MCKVTFWVLSGFMMFTTLSCGSGGPGDIVGDVVGDLSDDAIVPLACNPARGNGTVNLRDVESSDGFQFSGIVSVTSLQAETDDGTGATALTVSFTPAEGDAFRLSISVPGDDLLPSLSTGSSYNVYFHTSACGMWIEQNSELAIRDLDGGLVFWFMGRCDDAAAYGACGGLAPCFVVQKQASACTPVAGACGTVSVPNLYVSVNDDAPESVTISSGSSDVVGGMTIAFIGGFDIVGDNECTDGPSSWLKLVAVRANQQTR